MAAPLFLAGLFFESADLSRLTLQAMSFTLLHLTFFMTFCRVCMSQTAFDLYILALTT